MKQIRRITAIALAFGAIAWYAQAQDPAPAPTQDGVHDEDQLIAVLQDGAAGWAEKNFACMALRKSGTAKSVPALAALLTDENLSHPARYALEPMPYPEAGQALIAELSKADGAQKLGIVTSLGARREAAAVAALAPLLADPDAVLAGATGGALGRIGTPKAIEALQSAGAKTDGDVRTAIGEGLLAAGFQLLDAGRRPAAAAVFEPIVAAGDHWPKHVHMGAFRGLAHAQPRRSQATLLAALRGEDVELRGLAAQVVAENPNAGGTRGYASALRGLPEAGQVALLRGLGARGDALAKDVVIDTIASGAPEIRLAAIDALAKLGNAEDVPVLASLLTGSDEVTAAAARGGLAAMKAEGVDAALASALPEAVPAAKAKLLELLTDRMSPLAVPSAVANVGDEDLGVRLAALGALAQLGAVDEAPVTIASLKSAKVDEERDAAAKALGTICAHQKDAVLPAVIAAMAGASVEVRVPLLRALSQIGSAGALDAVVAALGDSEAQIGSEAARVLSNWTSQDAAPHLLALAKSEEASRKDLGLRGYVRLAREQGDLGAKVGMLNNAMDLAESPGDKWVVLAAWGTVNAPEALDALLPHLDDEAVRNEAGSAIIAVASELLKNEETKAKAVEALQAVVEKCNNEGVRDRAQKALPAG